MSNFYVLKWTSHTHSGLFQNEDKLGISKIAILKWKLELIVSHFKMGLFLKSLVQFRNGFFTLH